MRTEAEFSAYIWGILKRRGIDAHLEGNISDIEIINVLKTASKNFTGGAGYPDILAIVKDFVLVMESKSDYLKLEKKDGTDFSTDSDAIKNYAVNGALFYARKIFEGTHYTKIFAFGNAGDRVHHNFKPVFIGEGKDKKRVIKEFKSVEVFENFTEENIDAYYQQEILGEELPEDKELRKVVKYAENLHERLRNYGQLGETEKPLVVSGIILAMDDGLTLDELKGSTEENLSDGEIIFYHIVNRLNNAQVQPEVKKERVLAQFRLIKNRPLLNTVHPKIHKTPLKYFAEYIQDNIYEKVKKSGSIDYLGKFYREFVKYSGGDGQTLGVVLTPEHITKLFCDLVDLKADDVVLDPCCGTGGFLLAALDYTKKILDKAENEKNITDEQRKKIANLRENIKKNQLHGIEVRDDMFSIATTSMILRGDGKSNLICDDFFKKTAEDFFITDAEGKKCPVKFTVGFMNPPYSQAKNSATKELSELRFIEHLLNFMTPGGRVAVIVPVSAMIGKTKDDKILKQEILKHHTLKGVISLNKNTFYQIGTVPCIAVFEAGIPHKPGDFVKFINWEDDGYELRKHEGYKKTSNFKERREYLLECWRGNIKDVPSKDMVATQIDADDEWLHSFYYYNDEKPAESDFINTIADYLTFEFNMITHGRGYLFDAVKKNPKITAENVPPLENKIWQTFLISDLFEVFLPSGDTQADNCNEGKIPLISAGFNNNGVCKFIERGDDKSEIYGKNIISVDMFGKAFFHEYKFYSVSHGRINLLKPFKNLNRFQLQFLTIGINESAKNKFSYNQMCSSKRIKKLIVTLPVNELGAPDFEYMEKYIALREQKLIQQYLDRICPPNVAEIPPLENKIWHEFFIEEIFEIVSGCDIYEDKRKSGDTPYIGASANNNGICHFISNENETLEENCISVNRNGSVGYTFYHPYAALYSNDCRKLRPRHFDGKYISLFLTTQIMAQREKYNYGYKMGTGRLKKQKIMLPVTETGAPDFEYMEAYSKNLFAQVLKKYLDVIQ